MKDISVVAMPIFDVEAMSDGLVRVKSGDEPSAIVWTNVIVSVADRPQAGDYVIMGGGQPPRWKSKAEYEAEIVQAAADDAAEAERVEKLTPAEAQIEIMARYR